MSKSLFTTEAASKLRNGHTGNGERGRQKKKKHFWKDIYHVTCTHTHSSWFHFSAMSIVSCEGVWLLADILCLVCEGNPGGHGWICQKWNHSEIMWLRRARWAPAELHLTLPAEEEEKKKKQKRTEGGNFNKFPWKWNAQKHHYTS